MKRDSDFANERPVQRILNALPGVRATADGWVALCPVHEADGAEHTPSLRIAQGDDGTALVKCRVGCGTREILAAIGLTMRDLFPRANGHAQIVKEYDYQDEAGTLLFQSVRFEPKGFKQRAPKAGGCWEWKLNGVRRVIYRLPELLAADPAETVLIPEGEKDCDRLRTLGFIATTNAGGAGKWRAEYNEPLRGRHVILIPDNDDPGRAHVERVAKSLSGVAASIRVLTLDGLPPKGDISDWLDAGHTADELRNLAESAPQWKSAKSSRQNSDKPSGTEKEAGIQSKIANVVATGKIPKPALMTSIVEAIQSATGNWPARMGRLLFSPQASGIGVEWLDNSASLFGWIGTATKQTPHFMTGPGFHPKSEVFERLRQTAQEFSGVERYPHEPKMPGVYYACPDYVPGNGDRLNELVDMFSPAGDIDRDLILALFVTVFWGEYGATRPLFAITSDEGRGVGKTTLVEMVGHLVGGNFSFSLNENIEKVKERLLTSEFLTTRVALIDNVKSNRVSHADFEALITCRVISGKKLYVGEASRPNNLVWAMTLNGASFSTDISQRAVVIKLKRPIYSGTWEGGVRKFIDDHRDELIADCLGFLRRKPAPITDPDRWGPWCCQVVARLAEPNDALKVIQERRATTDSERSEAEEVEDDFAAKLAEFYYDPEKDKIFIPSAIACQWCRDARNVKHDSTNATGRWLTQQITEKAMKRLIVSRGRTHGRGYIWTGAEWNASDEMKTNLKAQIAAVEDERRKRFEPR
ncbi:MAG TPA: hypothetical protein VGP76_00660 [Planctomycetaceae bacterium]|jgi:hypothetical protein|nr:hypothetical protein [Planctomycetaceae bacterium]